MTGWWKLLIPLGLGVAAATLNYMGRTSDVQEVAYVGLDRDLKAGEEVKPEYLKLISLPKTNTSLNEVAIRFRDRAVVYGRTVYRNMKKGDMLLWGDITSPRKDWAAGEVVLHLALEGVSLVEDLRVGQEIAFILPDDNPDAAAPDKEKEKSKLPDVKDKNYQLVGPFRVHSLGRRVGVDDAALRGGPVGLQEINLIVPAPGEGARFDDKTHLLLQTHFSRGAGLRKGSIVIYSPDRPPAAAPPKTKKTED